MANDPEGLVEFEAAGKRFTAVFGFKAIKKTERHYEMPFFRAILQAMPGLSEADLADPGSVKTSPLDINFTDLSRLFGFSLAKHHPDLVEDAVDDLMDEIGINRATEILTEALSSTLGEGDDSSAPNPPKKASRRSRTG